jgi:hypothetical protein
MEFDENHPHAIVEYETFATRYVKLGDLVHVPAYHSEDFSNTKSFAAVVIGLFGHKAEVLGGPSGTSEVWDIKDLYWLKGAK